MFLTALLLLPYTPPPPSRLQGQECQYFLSRLSKDDSDKFTAEGIGLAVGLFVLGAILAVMVMVCVMKSRRHSGYETWGA